MDIEADLPAVELRRVNRDKDCHRRYHISLCHSLFGDPMLLVTWGRIGRVPRTRVETFDDSTARAQRRTELLARRSAHGYTVTSTHVGLQPSAAVTPA